MAALDAGFDIVSMIPFVGWGAKALKILNAARKAKMGTEAARRVGKLALKKSSTYTVGNAALETGERIAESAKQDAQFMQSVDNFVKQKNKNLDRTQNPNIPR